MGKRLTNEEFLEKLWEKNEHYRNGEFEVIGDFERVSDKILLSTEYGIASMRAQNILNGAKVMPESYINKEDYYLTFFKTFKNKCIYEKVETVDGRSYVTFNCGTHGTVRHRTDLHNQVKNCPKCSRSETNIEDIKLLRRNKNFKSINKIDDKLYETVCQYSHKTYTNRVNIVANKGCKVCRSIKNRLWFERETDFEKSHTYMSYLYLMRFEKDGEIFYKIGVAKNDKSRKSGLTSGSMYEITIVDNSKMSVFDAFTLENELLNLFKEYKYEPKYKFAGKTECFSENISTLYTDLFNRYIEYNKQYDMEMCKELGIN